jgi:ribosomal protein L24
MYMYEFKVNTTSLLQGVQKRREKRVKRREKRVLTKKRREKRVLTKEAFIHLSNVKKACYL